ncbi:thioredoxin-like protein [Blyttiomyces helicus]|uniref:Thioredoxin-like protein n=1 Tax=Blyttiomyces helicus TaxID=388810 RepID=A0A4P9W0C0_9FUNG|nr:thioredoxin-like protein [Blyttiomyces helicus]|eukprot:RKO85581.1 thioredoxin-like protein [Blyttiomyces helicus]
MSHRTFLPGQAFPNLTVANAAGGEAIQLVVIYRGRFCPFCRSTLIKLKAALPKLSDAGINLVAISADTAEATTALINDLQLDGLQIGYGLHPNQMRALGVFVTSPTDYIALTHVFAEPAWFLIDTANNIKYLDYGSAPTSGRPMRSSQGTRGRSRTPRCIRSSERSPLGVTLLDESSLLSIIGRLVNS